MQPTNDAAATPLAATHGIKDHEIRVSSFAMHYVFGKKLAPGLSCRSAAFAPLHPLAFFSHLSFRCLPPPSTRLFRARERERESKKGDERLQLIYFVHFLPVQGISAGVPLVSTFFYWKCPPFGARCRYNGEERRVSREFVKIFSEMIAMGYTRGCTPVMIRTSSLGPGERDFSRDR